MEVHTNVSKNPIEKKKGGVKIYKEKPIEKKKTQNGKSRIF